jgi:hypothetical protein
VALEVEHEEMVVVFQELELLVKDLLVAHHTQDHLVEQVAVVVQEPLVQMV